jgi:hypothetical protein
MVDVISLKTFKQQANEECIKKLTDLLSKAEKGEITGIAYAGIAEDGSVLFGSTKSDNFHALIGIIERMKWMLIYGEEIKHEGTI